MISYYHTMPSSSPKGSKSHPWTLRIWVDKNADGTDWQEVSTVVYGNYTIGQVMARIGEEIGSNHDLSDYALWHPDKSQWLKQCRMTLDQSDIYSTSKLQFITMHKPLRVQTPDLNVHEINVDFSVKVLTAVSDLCDQLTICHPEELSFAKPLHKNDLKRNISEQTKNFQRSTSTLDRSTAGRSTSSLHHQSNGTLNARSNGSQLNVSQGTISSNGSLNGSNYSLSSTDGGREMMLRPKTAEEKARLNSAWLDSSKSLYEQGVCENDLLLLKFKFFAFYDLSSKSNVTRIHHIYEQLKWAVLNEEIYCNEDEMYTLAALISQVNYLIGDKRERNGMNGNGNIAHHNINGVGYSPRNNNYIEYNGKNGHNGHHNGNGFGNGNGNHHHHEDIEEQHVDQIDCALENLEKILGAANNNGEKSNGLPNGMNNGFNGKMTEVPELKDKLKIRISQPKSRSQLTLTRMKFLNMEKSYFVVFRETMLRAYKDVGVEMPNGPSSFELDLNCCDVIPDVLTSQKKFCFRILQNSKQDSSCEYYIRCRDEKQYAEWYTACKQGSLGRTMANATYKTEMTSTLKLLKIQASSPTIKTINKDDMENYDPKELVSPKFLKRKSKEQLVCKIKSIRDNFAKLSLVEAQMEFINTCQKLRDYGITLFIIRHSKSKKKELLGVSSQKVMLIDINTGALLKSWPYKMLMDWHINWEVKKMTLNFNDENLEFESLCADCKVIHEFIGGYIYMSMRNRNKNSLDEDTFLELTGGQKEPDLLEANIENRPIAAY